MDRRAISDEQKEQRRQTILDAAARLFEQTEYGAVTMAQVAREAGIAKGTVYLYFDTKEELFLALQTQAFESWFEDVDAGLRELAGAGSIEPVVQLVGETLARRPILTRLIAIVHTILERNIDYEAALAFKRMLRARVLTTGGLLEDCLAFLRPGQGAQVLLRLHAVVIGMQHVAEPAPVVRQVLAQEAGMEVFRIDFNDEVENTLGTLLKGIERENGGGTV